MRILVTALCLSFVTACGISQSEHQRALEEQRKALMGSSDKTAAELQAKLADAEAALKKAQDEQKASSEELNKANQRVKLLQSALKAREAQIAWNAKSVVDAERLVRAAYDEAKAAKAASVRMLSEAFDLVQQKKPAAGQKIQEAAEALAREAL